MAYLRAAERRALPLSAFLLPAERALPVHDEGHWRAARGRIVNYPGQQKSLIAKWERIGRAKGWLKKEENHSDNIEDTYSVKEMGSTYTTFNNEKKAKLKALADIVSQSKSEEAQRLMDEIVNDLIDHDAWEHRLQSIRDFSK